MNNYYNKFVNLYSLSKTLRFRLKPQGKTKYWIEKNNIIKTDKVKRDAYIKLKPYFDQLHRNFVSEHLKSPNIKFSEAFEFYKSFITYKDKISEKKLNQKLDELRKEVVKLYSDYKILLGKEAVNLLEENFGVDIKDLISEFRGFTGYLIPFQQSRANFYSSENKETSIAHRIININLIRYYSNIIAFQKIEHKLNVDQGLLEVNNYNSLFLQKDIDNYNLKIGVINKNIKELSDKSEQKLPRLKVLYKQILGLKDKKVFIEVDENNFNSWIENYLKNSYDKSKFSLDALENLFSTKVNKEKVFFNKRAISTISGKYFTGGWNSLAQFYGEKIKNDKAPEKDYLSVSKILLANSLLKEGESFDNVWAKEINRLREQLNKSFEKGSKEVSIENIKSYADTTIEINRIIKYFTSPSIEALDSDEYFYHNIEKIIEDDYIYTYYNAIRNHYTKAPWSKDKIKLNFNSGSLLGGWDISKETEKLALIFKDNRKYYLGIINKSNNNIFKNKLSNVYNINKSEFQKMEFKLIPGPNKMLPKIAFQKNPPIKIPEEILKIRKEELFKKSSSKFNLNALTVWIEFMQKICKNYINWECFKFNFSNPSTYNSVDEFYREVEHQGYKLDFVNVDKKIIDQFIDEGKLYLFEIYNKDFSTYHKNINTAQNLETLYFKALFSDENKTQRVFKLNGEAEIFLRDPSMPTTKRKIKNKEIIEKKRYTEETFLLHVPITINYTANSKGLKFNDLFNKNISDKTTVLGIDRGEKHLLYYCLVDQNQKIIKQGSFNFINLKNYELKLHQTEEKRQEQRKNWEKIEQIKNTKKGYLSQVVYQITQLMLVYNSVVVLEDLNLRFMQKRGGRFERSVYQQFELALAKKLNCLVIKSANSTEVTGIFKALQLTPKTDNFKDIYRQHGAMLYVNPAYTSKIDPITGFYQDISLNYKNEKQARDLLSQFNFSYNKMEDYFEIKYKNWTLCSCVERLYNKRVENSCHFKTEKYQMTEEFKKIFNVNSNLQKQINSFDVKNLKTLIFYVKLLFQLRNSDSQTNQDYILSPVYPFFDSRKANDSQPKNGDANGAYNIARKGLLTLKKIRSGEKDTFVNLKEFTEFIQSGNINISKKLIKICNF